MTTTVLVVDDDATVRYVLAGAMVEEGHQVLEAADGPAAVALLSRHRVDLVLLDQHLPGARGTEVLQWLDEQGRLPELPVILITADDGASALQEAFAAGATDFLAKPVNLDELRARVDAHLRARDSWQRRLHQRLVDRAVLTDLLGTLDRSMPAADLVAEACSSIVRAEGAEAACIVSLPRAGSPRLLGTAGPLALRCEPGDAIDPLLAAGLRARTLDGPWIDRVPPGLLRSRSIGAYQAAGAPVRAAGQVAGAVLVIVEQHDLRSEIDIANLLSGAIHAAAAISMTMGERVAAGGEASGGRAQLERVVTERAFHPVFQPILDLTCGDVVGYEALTRFADGTPPEQRFAEASRLALGEVLELTTLEAAVAASVALPDSAWLSVNVSPMLLGREPALGAIVGSLDRPAVLEVTEHDRIDDYEPVRAGLARLPGDVRLSIDDTGSGFASLRHVLALAPAFVKLDRSWVHELQHDPTRQALVAGLCHFAREARCQLIAEGIETDAELRALQDLGVGLGQGFLLGRPALAG